MLQKDDHMRIINNKKHQGYLATMKGEKQKLDYVTFWLTVEACK